MNFNVLMENYNRVKELTEESAQSAGTADEKYEAYMDSMEAATKRLENAWESFTMKLESSKVLRYTSQWLATIVENMDKLVPLAITLLTTLKSSKIINFFTGSGGGKSGFANLFGTLTGRNWQMKMGEGGVKYEANQKESWLGRIFNVAKNIETNTSQISKNTSKTGEGGETSEGQEADVWNAKKYREQSRRYRKYRRNSHWNNSHFARLSGVYRTGAGDMSQKEIDEYKEYRSGLSKQRASRGTMAAVTAVIGRLSQTKQVGADGIGGLLSKSKGITETVEETAGDKAAGVVLSGVGAGVGAAFFGPIGGMVGQFIGDGISDLFTWLVHQKKLEMKQRSKEAKERVSSLDNISSTLESNKSLLEKNALDAEDDQKLKEFLNSLRDQISDYTSMKNNQENQLLEGIAEKFSTEDQEVKINNIFDVVDRLYDTTSSIRTSVVSLLDLNLEKAKTEDLIASQEAEREEIKKVKEKALYGSATGSNDDVYHQLARTVGVEMIAQQSLDSQISDIESIIKYVKENDWITLTTASGTTSTFNAKNMDIKGIVSVFQDVLSEKKTARNKEIQLNDALATQYVNQGFQATKVGLEGLTDRQIMDFGLEGVVQRIASNTDYSRDGSIIKSSYRNKILAKMQSDPRFASLFKNNSNITISDILKSRDNINGSESSLYIKSQTGELIDDKLEKDYYQGNTQKLLDFAAAWNTTTEKLGDLAKKFPELTQAIGMMTQSEVKEYFSDLHTILDDLFTDGTADAENFSKVLSKFPSLLSGIFNEGQKISDLIGTISSTAFEMENLATANSLISSIVESNSLFDEFLKTETGKGISKDVGDSKNFKDAIEKLKKDGKTDKIETIKNYLNKTIELDYEDPTLKKAIEFRTKEMEKQVNIYEEQLKSLEKINDQHKKEIELYKAMDNLENSKKNKNAVYREGVGWVYEANEDNIQAAKEKLDDIELDRQKEGINRQIEAINVQKEILNNLTENKNLETISSALGDLTNPSNKNSIANLVEAFKSQKLVINPGTGEITFTSGFDSSGNVKMVSTNTGGVDDISAQEQERLDYLKKKAENDLEIYSNNPSKEAYEQALKSRSEALGGGVKPDQIPKPEATKMLTMVKQGDATIQYTKDLDRYTDKKSVTISGTKYDDAIKIEKVRSSNLAYDNLQTYLAQYNSLSGERLKDYEVVSVGAGYYFKIGSDWFHVKPEYANHLKELLDASGSNTSTNATGTTSFGGGLSFINELGTEAIITPEGTLTSLPSKTGIVPADITKNLWGLGEVAPTLIAQLKTLTSPSISSNVGNNTYEEGQYIDNLVMNVYPTKDYDMDKLLAEARAKFRLTKHNN